jgi:uncharacterized Tic20 family protein
MTDIPNNGQTPADQPADQGYKIPVVPSDNPKGEDAPEVDSLVREYERKYRGFREDESPNVQEAATSYALPKPKSRPARIVNSYRGEVTEEERNWAMIAHLSVLLTLVIGIPSAGLSTLITIFVPLMIYFYYREKSEYVAYHALQAFALQVLGTVGWIAVLAAGGLVGTLLIVILAITIVGLLVVPFVVLGMVLFAVASFGLPIGMVVFGLIAAWEAYQGKWYQVPYVGRWIEQQMHGGFLTNL